MKKFIIPLMIFLFLLTASIMMFAIIVYNKGKKEDQKASEEYVGSTNYNQENSNGAVEDSRIAKSTGLKFWSQDENYTLLLSFFIDPEKYSVQYNEYESKNEVIVSFDKGSIDATLEHMAVPRQFSNLVALQNELTGNIFYRAIDDQNKIVYVDELMDVTECKRLRETMEEPCGYSRYEGILITCSSESAIQECDEVMKTLIVEDGPQLELIGD